MAPTTAEALAMDASTAPPHTSRRMIRRARLGLFASLMLVALAAPKAATAADCGSYATSCVDSDVLWPTAGPSTFFSLPSVQTVARGSFGFGIASSIQHDPIVFRTSATSPEGSTRITAIGDELTSTFLFSYGVTDRLEIDVAAPFTLFQTGTGTERLTGSPEYDIPKTAQRDVRFGAGFEIIPLPRTLDPQGGGVLARLDVSIPNGDKDLFAGDRGFVLSPTLAYEDRIGRFTADFDIGARIRKTTTLLGGSPGAIDVGPEALVGLGLSYAFDTQRIWSATGEAFLLAPLVHTGAHPAQWLAGVRWSPIWAGDFTMHGGFGTSFQGDSATVLDSTWRAMLDLRYAPVGRDSDGDGIPDKDDKCPFAPEDKDGFEDTDGCPDLDNDHDGIVDALDKCPDEAEDKNGVDDDDGCPDPDRDGDGIADTRDKCPDKPEDINGYQDEDGCPEGGPPKLVRTRCEDGTFSEPGGKCDVDKDGVTDDIDGCPLAPEDKDGIVDDDGCPEKDADEDGIADELDKCPLQAETIDGVDDGDGCPEPGAHSHVTYAAGAIEVNLDDHPVTFGGGSATVSAAMKKQLAMIAQRAQGLVDRGVKEIVVEGWADSAGDTKPNQALAQKRADAIKAAFIASGIPEALVKARPGDLVQMPSKGKPTYLVSVRVRRKEPLGKRAPVSKSDPKPDPKTDAKPAP